MDSSTEKISQLNEIKNWIIKLEEELSEAKSVIQSLSAKNEEQKLYIKKIENLNKINFEKKNTDIFIKKENDNIKLDGNLEITEKPKSNFKNISLGINNLSVRNDEAIHDALSYFNKHCPYCKNDLFQTTKRKKYEIDHFFPINKGGQDVPWNLLPVCQKCNRKKRDKNPQTFLEWNTYVEVTSYLKEVKQKFLSEGVDSYIFKEKLIELIDNESAFVHRYIGTNFMDSILSLVDQHHWGNDKKSLIQKNLSKEDKLEIRIIKFLNTDLPMNWESLTLNERIDFYKGVLVNDIKSSTPRSFVCIAEIWCECLYLDKKDMNRYNTRDINKIMKRNPNWIQRNSTKNFPKYGKQRYFEKI